MKVMVVFVPEVEIEPLLLDVEEGEIPVITKAAFRDVVLACRELILSNRVVEDAAREGMSPDEFAAWFIKQADASQ